MRFIILLPLIVVFSQSVVATKMYSYIDENGQRVYTQFQPKPGLEAEIVKPPPPPPSTAQESQDKLASDIAKDKEQKEKRLEAGKKAKVDAENQKIMQKNCETARKNLQALNTKGRVKLVDQDGKPIDDEGRKAKLKQAQEAIKNNCK